MEFKDKIMLHGYREVKCQEGRCGTNGTAMYLFWGGGGILDGRNCCWVVIHGSGCVEIC